MNEIILKHKEYYLRSLTVSDVTEDYLRWMTDKDVVKYLEIRYSSYDFKNLESYVSSFVNDDTKFLFGIFNVNDNKHIGNATIYDINYKTGTFDIGYLIGEKYFWGKGVGNIVCLLLMEFGFEKLNLRKLFTGTYSNNLSSRFIWKSIGCIEEGKLVGKFLFEDKPIDEVIYSMDKRNWEEIKEKIFI